MAVTQYPQPQQASQSSLPGVAENDKLVMRGRIKDANAVREIHKNLEYLDQQAAYNRALVQAQVDGMPPINPQDLAMAGQGQNTNVNWGKSLELIEEAKAPYPALIQNTETLCALPIRKSFGDDQLRNNLQPIIEEEFTVMVMAWVQFYDYYMQLVHQIKVHGVGITFWPDEYDWRFEVAGLETFKFPRNTKPFASDVELCSVKIPMLPHILMQKIKDPEVAKELGWNVEAVKKALMRAGPQQPAMTDWEQWERYYKNNDYLMSFAGRQVTVNAVICWSKELDGTVSVYVVDYDSGDNQFLYKKEGRFSAMGDQMVIFADGVGSNAYLDSIRGMASLEFPKVAADNRLTNRLVDLILFNSTPLFQASNEDAMNTMAITPVGMYNIKSSDWEMPEREMPDYGQSLFPLIQTIHDRMTSAASRHTRSVPSLQGKQPLTKYGEEARQATLAGLGEAGMNLFIRPLTLVFRNMVKRLIRKDYLNVDPGGPERHEFFRRCLERGVPEDAILNIDIPRVKFSPPLGAGTPEQRALKLERLIPAVGNFDQTGQKTFWRDYVIASVDVSTADRYTPRSLEDRIPMDASIAQLENNQLKQGMPVEVIADQNHVVHATVHLTDAQQIVGSVDPNDSEAVVQMAQMLPPLLEHSASHLELADYSNPDVRQLIKLQQNLQGTAQNALKHAARVQEQMERDSQGTMGAQTPDGQPADGTEPGGTLQMQLAEAMVKLQLMQEDHQQKLRQREEDHQQKLALRDAEVAAKITRGS